MNKYKKNQQQNMSEEDKQKRKVYQKNHYQNMSEEEKQKKKYPKKIIA